MSADKDTKPTGDMKGRDSRSAETLDDGALDEAALENVTAGQGPAEWFPRWTCLYCPEVFRSEHALMTHMKHVHGHDGTVS